MLRTSALIIFTALSGAANAMTFAYTSENMSLTSGDGGLHLVDIGDGKMGFRPITGPDVYTSKFECPAVGLPYKDMQYDRVVQDRKCDVPSTVITEIFGEGDYDFTTPVRTSSFTPASLRTNPSSSSSARSNSGGGYAFASYTGGKGDASPCECRFLVDHPHEHPHDDPTDDPHDDPLPPVPVPMSSLLLLTGLATLVGARRVTS